MSQTMSRSQQALEPVCHWCKEDIQDDIPYRANLEGIDYPGTVGWVICSPACPSRPTDQTVWKRQHWSEHARH